MKRQTEENKDAVAIWQRWKPAHTTLSLSLVTAGVLLAAYRRDPYALNPAMLIGFSFMVGFFGASFHVRRLGLAMCGLVLGLVIGIFSSLDFFVLPVEGVYYAVLTSLIVYVFLGLIIGGFAETVRFLHFVAHGGKPRDYPSRQPAK